MTKRSVVLSMDVETDEQVRHAFEMLARVAAGLTLDGYEARVWAHDHAEEVQP